MPSVQIFQYFSIDAGERVITGGSLSQARSIALGDGEVIDRQFSIAAEGIVKLFDKTADAALGDFDFCWIENDLPILIQLVTDAGGDDEYFVIELAGSGTAGQMGPATILSSDLAHQFDGAVDLFTGTADTIDEIWAENEDTTDAARVRLVVAT